MNIVTLKVFAEVARRGSFTEAAVALQISKGQCSKLVSNLETSLGVKLLERTTRRVRLTSVGAGYLADITPLLRELEAANERAARGPSAIRERIWVAAPECISSLFILPIIDQLMRANHALAFSITPSVPWSRRLADVSIIYGDAHALGAVLFREDAVRLVLVARPDYLFSYGAPVHPRDLKQHRVIMQGGLTSGGDIRFLTPNGSEEFEQIEPVFVASDGRIIRDAALAAKGIALLPHYLVEAALSSSELVQVLPEHQPLAARIKIVGTPEILTLKAGRAFLELLGELEMWSDPVIGASGAGHGSMKGNLSKVATLNCYPHDDSRP